MSRPYRVRPHYETVQAVRFLPDEPGVEPIYVVGLTHFPASVFEEIFQYDNGADRPPSPPVPEEELPLSDDEEREAAEELQERVLRALDRPSPSALEYIVESVTGGKQDDMDAIRDDVRNALAHLVMLGQVRRVKGPAGAKALIYFERVG